MATSPNYAWAEPDNSSLVKNGAADIRTLGDAIDASVWNIGFGQAGKNKFINADFRYWQRGTTAGPASLTQYLADRFYVGSVGDTVTYSQQTFTAGAAPVAGYESQYFARQVVAFAAGASNYTQMVQRIEDVRTFAGQTVTISYWAKADAAKSVAWEVQQNFGSGGSANVNTFIVKQALTTSWARYSTTFTVPSVSGKTIGTSSILDFRVWLSAGSTFDARTSSLGQQNITFDTWGWQVEYGSKATPFQTASGGSPQAELAMCQRYYYRPAVSAAYQYLEAGFATSTTAAWFPIRTPSTFRVAAASVEYSTLAIYNGGSIIPISAATLQSAGNDVSTVAVTVSGASSGGSYFLITNNSSAGYIGLSAEL